jgi:hypothetical protein
MNAQINKKGTAIVLSMAQHDWHCVEFLIRERMSQGDKNELMKHMVAKLYNITKMLVTQPETWKLSITNAAVLEHVLLRKYYENEHEYIGNQIRMATAIGKYAHLWRQV